MQSALLISNRQAAMGQTAGAIAHELKNALNGLGLAIDLLTSGDVPKGSMNTITGRCARRWHGCGTSATTSISSGPLIWR